MKLGPRLFSTGTILYGAETPFKAIIDNYEDALSALRRQKAFGAFSVKSYNQQRRDARQMIIKAARELQMEVVPEGGLAPLHERDDDPRRPHDGRALAAGAEALQGRRHAVRARARPATRRR